MTFPNSAVLLTIIILIVYAAQGNTFMILSSKSVFRGYYIKRLFVVW